MEISNLPRTAEGYTTRLSHHTVPREPQYSFLSFIILEYILLLLKLLGISSRSTDDISKVFQNSVNKVKK